MMQQQIRELTQRLATLPLLNMQREMKERELQHQMGVERRARQQLEERMQGLLAQRLTATPHIDPSGRTLPLLVQSGGQIAAEKSQIDGKRAAIAEMQHQLVEDQQAANGHLGLHVEMAEKGATQMKHGLENEVNQSKVALRHTSKSVTKRKDMDAGAEASNLAPAALAPAGSQTTKMKLPEGCKTHFL